MTNQDVWRIALEQSAIDCGCQPSDFLKTENVIVPAGADPRARVYLPRPVECDLVSYGSNVVAQVSDPVREAVTDYVNAYPASFSFETPHLYVLNEALAPFGLKACYIAEYFLPDVDLLRELPCPYETRLLGPADFAEFYRPEWSNALCEQRREFDMLAVGAYDGEALVGLAGASADCESMWQIGVDVLPAYRRRGIAAALTSRLAWEVFERGRVPFYCAAWCNLKSVRNALKCGFRPAWVELTARSVDHIEELNRR